MKRSFLLIIILFFASSCSWFVDDSEWVELFGEKEKFNALNVDFEKHYAKNKSAYKKVLARGSYLTKHVTACGVCHGEKAGDPNSPLSGGRIIEDERGLVVASNITPHESGIKDWTIAELVRVIRKGKDRAGEDISKTMHLGYRWLSDADARAIAMYIKTRPAVENKIENSRGGGINFTFGSEGLQILTGKKDFDGYVPSLSERNSLYYGEYLANNVANCYACHTGDVKNPYAGSEEKGVSFIKRFRDFFDFDFKIADNIKFGTLDQEYGDQENFKKYAKRKENQKLEKPELVFPQLGPDIRGKVALASWSERDIINYLSSGNTPSKEKKNPELCPWPYFKGMTKKDKAAIAKYLKSIG